MDEFGKINPDMLPPKPDPIEKELNKRVKAGSLSTQVKDSSKKTDDEIVFKLRLKGAQATIRQSILVDASVVGKLAAE